MTDRALTPEVLGQEKRCLLEHRWLLWRVHLGKGNVCCRGCLHGLLEDYMVSTGGQNLSLAHL